MVFPEGDKTGLEADDDDACWMGVRAGGKCGKVGVCVMCEWCNLNWATEEIEPAPTVDIDGWCESERLVKEAPSSGWLLCTITLLLVACVCSDVDDGWPLPDISIFYNIFLSLQTISAFEQSWTWKCHSIPAIDSYEYFTQISDYNLDIQTVWPLQAEFLHLRPGDTI